MALRRKGSRLITIDDITYRWTVAPNDEPGVAAVVEGAAAPGQRLVTWFEHGVTITPIVVRAAIVYGRSLGWDPARRGPDVVVHNRAGDPTSALAQCPCCDYFTLPIRGGHDICKVCFWEDDGRDLDDLDSRSGPNHGTLREARQHFAEHGACDTNALAHVIPASARDRFARVRRST